MLHHGLGHQYIAATKTDTGLPCLFFPLPVLLNFGLHMLLLFSNYIYPTLYSLLNQEAAALAATEVAFMLQAGQRRSLQVTIAPGPGATPHQAATPQQEPLQ